jgi:hypothetical protein
MDSPGLNFKAYAFWNKKDIGIFVHDSFLFPSTLESKSNGITTNVDLSIYDLILQVGLIIGPGFRHSFTNSLKLYYGFGFSFLQTTAMYNQLVSYNMLAYNFGIGGDVGIKYDISDFIYFSIGSAMSYDFKNFTLIKTSYGNTSSWSDISYRMYSLRPYIGIGMNFYQKDINTGKPNDSK